MYAQKYAYLRDEVGLWKLGRGAPRTRTLPWHICIYENRPYFEDNAYKLLGLENSLLMSQDIGLGLESTSGSSRANPIGRSEARSRCERGQSAWH